MNEKLVEFLNLRPKMATFYDFTGTYDEYSDSMTRNIVKNSAGKLDDEIFMEAKRMLSSEISPSLLKMQLEQFPVISYADHHGLLNYGLLYNSNILFSNLIQKLKLPFLIVFASGSVPMVTRSHPRGFYFKGQKFNFFGEKQSKLPVTFFSGKLNANRSDGLDSFLVSYEKESLTEDERRFLECLFFDYLHIERAARDFTVFSDQLTFLNNHLWKCYFDLEIRDSIPELVYLQSNKMIVNLLKGEIENDESLISMILFDPHVRKIFLESFNNIPACWGESMGSHFFWGVVERRNKTRIIRLLLNDETNQLEGEDFTIKLTKSDILHGLKEHKILQTSFFDLLLVTFLNGYLALGGFNQLEYLPKMQIAHVQSLRTLGMNELADLFSSRKTDGLICGLFPFAFDSAIDLIWNFNSKNGVFSGNLDRGISASDFFGIGKLKVKDMIEAAVDKMMENI